MSKSLFEMKQFKHPPSAFRGWGWTELAPMLLGISVDGQENEVAVSAAIENLLYEYAYSDEHVPEEKQAIGEQIEGVCREFLEVLASWDTYERSVWLGVLAVEDRFTFFQVFARLLGFMWV